MSSEDRKTLDLAAALEDLRRIREVVDRARANHPVRLVARPLLGYALSLGLAVIAFGVAGEVALRYGRGDLIWALGGALLVAAWLGKLVLIDAASRRVGYDIVSVLRETFTRDYLRILVPGAFSIALAGQALHTLGGDHLILGFVLAACGALLIPLTAAIALEEWALMGVWMFLSGAAAMGVFPGRPFLTLAVCWGGALVVGAVLLRSRFPALPR